MRILLIEDNRELCKSLSFQLENRGCQIDICDNGSDVFYYLDQRIYDMILLDPLLPHMDGQTVLKKLRADKDTTPVIFLCTSGKLKEKANGPQAGANNDPAKPFALEELMEKIHGISHCPVQQQQTEVFHHRDITYYSTKHLLTGPAGQCTLSQKEGALLHVFLSHPSQTLSRPILLSEVWGPDVEVEDGNLDNYMYLIRRRLKSVGSDTKIHTIRGIGYQLEDACV